MNKVTKRRIWQKWRDEAQQDEEQEERINRRLTNWMRGTKYLGLALFLSIAAVVPFLSGYSLHYRWDALGKKIVVLAMILFVSFVYAAGTTYNFWVYLRGIKSLHRKFAPPGSKYRIGK
jgi:nicotinamide riboside transporter PnuC